MTPGRPALYHPDCIETAYNDCLLGATNADLAGCFDVAPRTVDNWIATHYDAAAVRQGWAAADWFARIEFTTSRRVGALVQEHDEVG